MHGHIRLSAIIIKASQVLLMHKNNDGKEYWIFPGTQVKADSPSKKTLIDEIDRLIGLKISTILEEKEFFDQSENILHYYIVCEIEEGQLNAIEEVRWFNFTDALALPKLYPIAPKDHLKFIHEKEHENKKKLY